MNATAGTVAGAAIRATRGPSRRDVLATGLALAAAPLAGATALQAGSGSDADAPASVAGATSRASLESPVAPATLPPPEDLYFW